MEIKKTNEPFARPADSFQPIKAVLVIMGFLFIVGMVWFLFMNMGSPETKPPEAKDMDLSGVTKPADAPALQDSFYKNYVKLSLVEAVKETYPEKEYLQFSVIQSNLSGVDISKWQIMNSKGEKVEIGKGAELFVEGKVNTQKPIIITGSDTVIISTGRSPKGVSFKRNKCSGYFEQFQDFVPPLPIDCFPVSQSLSFSNLDFNCQQSLYNAPLCMTNTKPLPSNASAACKSFVTKTMNYNGCVTANKNDTYFFVPEWRVFLGRDKEMWAVANETVTLLDDKGAAVDVLKY